MAALVVITAVAYLWALDASGWANSFYSAAAQAGSQSWKAWFFGASDAAGSITVDKTPASLWVMGLSVRMFGLSSWSILVPQALMGVATVGLVYASVRRHTSAGAALLAGAVMATTPVAALMFRFNNPDALLVLLMTLAAWAVLRGIDDGRRRWIVWAGVALGFGFLAKQLQVMLVVPALAAAWLLCAPSSLRRRLVDLLAAGMAMIFSAGWWLAIVELWPASNRPYIGGSQNNSILELTLGYNGLGRLTGNEVGSVGAGQWGETGLTRMFDGVIGGQIAWLLPAALALIVIGLWLTRRTRRTDPVRAALIVWGGWLIVTGLTFSLMAGIFHEYYTVALAPAIAALVGIGGHLLWLRRHEWWGSLLLGGLVATTSVWSWRLLERADGWNTWLGPAVLVVGLVAASGIVLGRIFGGAVVGVAAGAAIVAVLAGPAAWAIDTIATPQTGAIVTAGPVTGFGGPGGFGGGNTAGAQFGGPADGGGPNGGSPADGGAAPRGDGTSRLLNGGPGGGGPGDDGGPAGGGGIGGLLDATEPSEAIVTALLDGADDYTWVAAVTGANQAAGFQLAVEESVMPIGGFNGSDPSPTLEQFQEYVENGEIHWYIAGDGFGRQNGGSETASEIAEWVAATFTATTVDGITLYDLTA